MFRVFICVVVFSVVHVNCALNDTKAELNAQVAYLSKICPSDVSQMELHTLADKNATCNDGTTAGYYMRKANGSKRWIVYLEGGWFCHSPASCRERNRTMRELMTSNGWKTAKRGMGILSPNPRENPSWWNANHVYIPYCSSDVWSGNASKRETGGQFSFLGTRILARVIEELLPEGLYHAKHLLLAGSSAGGVGVILNLDRLALRLKMAGSKVKVRGLADSGWFLAGEELPMTSAAIRYGMNYWRGIVPTDCARRNPLKKWKCYFGEHVYKTDSASPKHAPLFVFQWLYDKAQLAWVLSGIFNVTREKVTAKIAIKLGKKMNESLSNTDGLACAVFAPSCVSHTILTRNDWLKVRVSGRNLDDALNAWYRHQSSDPNTDSCKTLIENNCYYPQCDKTCPKIGFERSKKSTINSPGMPVKPDSRNKAHNPLRRRRSRS